jgi:gluconate 5-dehydrogenase
MSVLDRFRLDGKRLFITGGSRGFGRVIALAAAEAGADIVLNARDPQALAKTADEVRQRGRQAWTYSADIAQPTACEALCGRVLAEAGPIDILVNNVGGRNLDIAIEDTDLKTWQTPRSQPYALLHLHQAYWRRHARAGRWPRYQHCVYQRLYRQPRDWRTSL